MMFRRLLRNLLTGPVAPQLRRFVAVGVFVAGIQMALLWLFVDIGRLNYILAAAVAIETTIVISYVLNNAWTFQASRNSGWTEYLHGLGKTNVVRGTAIPIQLAVLFVLVDWQGISYLSANAVAIFVSGIYRYVLDRRWTWG
jgi:putative flippase GtrA